MAHGDLALDGSRMCSTRRETTMPSTTQPRLTMGETPPMANDYLRSRTESASQRIAAPGCVLTNGSFYLRRLHMDTATTCVPRGDVSADCVLHLQAFLGGLTVLRSCRQVIDWSGSGLASLETSRIINRYREEPGGLVLRSSNAATRANPVNLTCSGKIGPSLTLSRST